MQPKSFDEIKELSKKFMTTEEIRELGLDPFCVEAGKLRKLGFHAWVPIELPDTAQGASFSVGLESNPNILSTIVIWNSDTFVLPIELDKDLKKILDSVDHGATEMMQLLQSGINSIDQNTHVLGKSLYVCEILTYDKSWKNVHPELRVFCFSMSEFLKFGERTGHVVDIRNELARYILQKFNPDVLVMHQVLINTHSICTRVYSTKFDVVLEQTIFDVRHSDKDGSNKLITAGEWTIEYIEKSKSSYKEIGPLLNKEVCPAFAKYMDDSENIEIEN
jgi:hypothetical protein